MEDASAGHGLTREVSYGNARSERSSDTLLTAIMEGDDAQVRHLVEVLDYHVATHHLAAARSDPDCGFVRLLEQYYVPSLDPDTDEVVDGVATDVVSGRSASLHSLDSAGIKGFDGGEGDVDTSEWVTPEPAEWRLEQERAAAVRVPDTHAIWGATAADTEATRSGRARRGGDRERGASGDGEDAVPEWLDDDDVGGGAGASNGRGRGGSGASSGRGGAGGDADADDGDRDVLGWERASPRRHKARGKRKGKAIGGGEPREAAASIW